MAEVRWAHRGEAPRVYPLFRALSAAEHTEPPSPSAFSRMWGRSFREGSTFRFAVAEAEPRRVVGCMSLHDLFSTWKGAPVVSLEDFFVLPEERNKGIGAGMLAFAERYAQELGAARVELHVQRDNERAQQLYQRTGYETTPYLWLHKVVKEAEGRAGGGAALGAMAGAPPRASSPRARAGEPPRQQRRGRHRRQQR